jgi:hypothetical protein
VRGHPSRKTEWPNIPVHLQRAVENHQLKVPARLCVGGELALNENRPPDLVVQLLALCPKGLEVLVGVGDVQIEIGPLVCFAATDGTAQPGGRDADIRAQQLNNPR